MRRDLGPDNCMFVHVSLVPYISAAHELKTKPTQHSVMMLRQLGISPDALCCAPTARSISPSRTRSP